MNRYERMYEELKLAVKWQAEEIGMDLNKPGLSSEERLIKKARLSTYSRVLEEAKKIEKKFQ